MSEAVANGIAATSVSGWRANSAAGPVTLRRLTGLSGPFRQKTGIEISRPRASGNWAYTLASLKYPTTFFKVGEVYRMQAWIRDPSASGEQVGMLLANGNYNHRPAEVSQYQKLNDSSWRLFTRMFTCTSSGFADTAVYLSLPRSAAFRILVTGVSVQKMSVPQPNRTTARASQVLSFAGRPGASPDPSVWSFDIGGHGWGNGELQTYTSRPVNAQLDGNNHLRITARRETLTGRDGIRREYTSARLTTRNKVSVAPGSYIEAAITLPVGTGLWPAFWLLGDNVQQVGWPVSGELDIMESKGSRPTNVFTAAHMASQINPKVDAQYGWEEGGGNINLGHRIDMRTHTYGVYFDANTIRFYLDRTERRALWARDASDSGRSWPFDKPMHILVNVAIANEASVNQTAFPKSMTVGPISIWSGGVPF